jgi:hypothetical protein
MHPEMVRWRQQQAREAAIAATDGIAESVAHLDYETAWPLVRAALTERGIPKRWQSEAKRHVWKRRMDLQREARGPKLPKRGFQVLVPNG